MALIICPECTRQISDRAASCPGCGFPLNTEQDYQNRMASETRPAQVPQDTVKRTEVDKCDKTPNQLSPASSVNQPKNRKRTPGRGLRRIVDGFLYIIVAILEFGGRSTGHAVAVIIAVTSVPLVLANGLVNSDNDLAFTVGAVFLIGLYIVCFLFLLALGGVQDGNKDEQSESDAASSADQPKGEAQSTYAEGPTNIARARYISACSVCTIAALVWCWSASGSWISYLVATLIAIVVGILSVRWFGDHNRGSDSKPILVYRASTLAGGIAEGATAGVLGPVLYGLFLLCMFVIAQLKQDSSPNKGWQPGRDGISKTPGGQGLFQLSEERKRALQGLRQEKHVKIRNDTYWIEAVVKREETLVNLPASLLPSNLTLKQFLQKTCEKIQSEIKRVEAVPTSFFDSIQNHYVDAELVGMVNRHVVQDKRMLAILQQMAEDCPEGGPRMDESIIESAFQRFTRNDIPIEQRALIEAYLLEFSKFEQRDSEIIEMQERLSRDYSYMKFPLPSCLTENDK